ncbi:MAG: helix-turn-helix transcriptional regulator [Treponema sp.]|jgi:putative molybdopterin biosynthesis protein|nr:helix-turn-helix transcriptional regulator [Treponema sp.]
MGSNLLTAEDVAQQLRIKKYTVYELIKRGELPSSKVGKQVRVSQADIDRYLASNKTGPQYSDRPLGSGREVVDLISSGRPSVPGNRVESPVGKNPDPFSALGEASLQAAVIISGQDMCLDLLVARLSGTGNTVLRSYVGCYNGLYSLYHGRVTMSAAHLWDAETDSYNYPFIRRLLPGLPVGVFRLGGRMQGLYVRKGNPLNIQDWRDFSRPELTMINRERGSGTRILLDQKLARLGIDTAAIRGYAWESTSHLGCAGTVAKGSAELGCGCERGIEGVGGVEFVPLQLEWYDFVFRLADRNTPVIRTISSYITSDEFKRDLEIMGGYDLSQTGRYEEF